MLVECCIGFVVCMYVRSSAEERPCRALELKSINQSINQSTSRKILKVSKTHALPLDDSVYATSKYNLQFLNVHSEMPTSP